MRTFKKIVLWILAILAVLIIVSYLLPGRYKVERTTYIKAGNEVVYGLVCNLHKWTLWEPWNKIMDSSVVYTFTGNDCQVGALRTWDGKILGNGQMIIAALEPGKSATFDLAFGKGRMRSTSTFLLEPAGDSLKVTWSIEGKTGFNPLNRYFSLFMDRMMGKDFDKGLASLKKVAEEHATWPRIEEKTFPARTVLFVRDSAGPKDYGTVLGKGYGEIMAFVKTNKLKTTGAPFAVYLKWDSATQFSVMDLGIPVEQAKEGKGRVRVENMPEQKAVVAYYFGPYEKTYKTYMALGQYVKEGELQEAGGPWEIYITDPMVEKDTMKWETDIVFPVK